MSILDSLRQRWEERGNRLIQDKQRRYEESMRELEHQKLPLQNEKAAVNAQSPLERISPNLAQRAQQAASDRENPPDNTQGIIRPTTLTHGHQPPGSGLGPAVGGGRVAGAAQRTPVSPASATPQDPMQSLDVKEAQKPEARPHERLAATLDDKPPDQAIAARVVTASLLQRHRDDLAQQQKLNR